MNFPERTWRVPPFFGSHHLNNGYVPSFSLSDYKLGEPKKSIFVMKKENSIQILRKKWESMKVTKIWQMFFLNRNIDNENKKGQWISATSPLKAHIVNGIL